MWTLIKREFREYVHGFAVILLITTVAILATACLVGSFDAENTRRQPPIGLPGIMIAAAVPIYLIVFPLFWVGLGVHQTYTDRSRRTSAFLSMLATDRRRILGAKIVTGTAAILATTLLVLFSNLVILHYYPRPLPVDYGLLVRLGVVAFSVNLACYAMGVQMGWTANLLFPTLGSIVLSMVMVTISVARGLGVETVAVCLIVAFAFWVRAWHTFSRSAL